MIERLHLEVKWTQAKAKLNNLRLKYIEVKKWLDGTGQGVDSGTIEGLMIFVCIIRHCAKLSISGYKNSKCPYFDMLDGIYSVKANISIPYLYDSLQTHKRPLNDAKETHASSNEGTSYENYDAEQEIGNGELDGENRDNLTESRSICDNDAIDRNGENNYENLDEIPSDINNERDYGDDIDDLTNNEILSIINLDSYLEEIGPCSPSVYSQQSHPSTKSSSVQEIRSSHRNTDAAAVRSDNFLTSSNESHSQSCRLQQSLPNQRSSQVRGRITKRKNTNDTAAVSDEDSENEIQDSRIARFRKQLSERPDGAHKRYVPSNAAAFVSDANQQRAQTLHERNDIELSRLDFDKLIHHQQLQLSKGEAKYRKQQLTFSDKELEAKMKFREKKLDLKLKQLDLKKKEIDFDFRFKVMELQKAERMEKLKIELECQLKLDIAKTKQ